MARRRPPGNPREALRGKTIVTFDGMTDGIESTIAQDASTHPGLKMYA